MPKIRGIIQKQKVSRNSREW